MLRPNIVGLNQFLSNYGLASLFALFFILDGFGKTHIFSKTVTSLPLVIKGIVSVATIVVSVLLSKNMNFYIRMAILAIIFCIAQWTLEVPFMRNNVILFGKFITPLLFFELFNKISMSKESTIRLFKIFEWTIVINSLLIFIGFIFKIKLFESYLGHRFGYNGLFVTSGVASYCTLITLVFYYFNYKKGLWKNTKFWIFFLSCFFIGTKVVYLGILVFLIIWISQINTINKKYVFLFFTLLLAIVFYIFFFEVGLFAKLTNEKGIVSSLLSFRDQLFIERTLPYIQENWDWKNYLFGGVSDYRLRSQMELVDVPLFWGLLGAIAYLSSYWFLYANFKINKGFLVFTILFSVIFLFTGNYFVYTTIAFFLLIFRESMSHSGVIQNKEARHVNN